MFLGKLNTEDVDALFDKLLPLFKELCEKLTKKNRR